VYNIGVLILIWNEALTLECGCLLFWIVIQGNLH
jgi:hypothetical protein